MSDFIVKSYKTGNKFHIHNNNTKCPYKNNIRETRGSSWFIGFSSPFLGLNRDNAFIELNAILQRITSRPSHLIVGIKQQNLFKRFQRQRQLLLLLISISKVVPSRYITRLNLHRHLKLSDSFVQFILSDITHSKSVVDLSRELYSSFVLAGNSACLCV